MFCVEGKVVYIGKHTGLRIEWSGFELWPGHCVALCSWAKHFTLTVSLFVNVYKWVLANLLLVYPCDGLRTVASYPGGSRNTCSCFMLWKPG